MAAKQPTPAELKEALSLLKQLKKGYADLGQENPFASINSDNIEETIKAAGGVNAVLKQWTLALDKVEDSLENVGKSAKGIYQQFNNIVGELKKGNQNINLGSKSMSVFQKTAEKLKNDQQGITRLSKTELETLKKQNKQALSNLDIANTACLALSIFIKPSMASCNFRLFSGSFMSIKSTTIIPPISRSLNCLAISSAASKFV